jgi:putative MFS transporter
MSDAAPPRKVWFAVMVAALGYFVDIYDLILFGVVRVASLKSLGIEGEAITEIGTRLIDAQMYGMLLGGILWGILGDRRGRLSVLFGSIVMYSVANIANGFVQDVDTYMILRFVAGVGLAGELGAGITLVAEIMPPEKRGYGTTIIATVGLLGAVVASLVGGGEDPEAWRHAYFVGGAMGLALLALRIGTFESGMFEKVKQSDASRGNLLLLVRSKERLLRYVSVVLIGVPIWYVVGILGVFSPEIGTALGMATAPVAGTALAFCYTGLSIGDLASGLLSQFLKGRRRVVLLFLLLMIPSIAFYYVMGPRSTTWFYSACFVLGFASGYWAVFVTLAAEQFGTNIRATVATTAPNFVRGMVPLLTAMFAFWRPEHGADGAAWRVGAAALAVAFVALCFVHETYGKDLDYLEEATPSGPPL